MHLLVSEASQVPNLALVTGAGVTTTSPTITLETPWLRPRLQGTRQALRGDAFSAKAADYARVQFTVRLPNKNTLGTAIVDVYNNYQALLSVQQSPLLGQNPETDYPSFVADVSGDFAIEGRIAVDVAIYGTCRVVLQLIRRTNPSLANVSTLYTLTQVFAEQWTLDVVEDGRLRGEE